MLRIVRQGGGFKLADDEEIVSAKVEMHIKYRRNIYDVYLSDNNEDRVLYARLGDVPEDTAINFKRDLNWSAYQQNISISLRNDLTLYSIKIDVGNWAEPFRTPEYITKFIEVLKRSENPYFDLKSISKDHVSIYTKFSDDLLRDKYVFEKINDDLNFLHKCYKSTISELMALSPDSMRALFSFPEYIRIPCKQYLIYFVQFLQDLGISTVSNMQEESGRVLFSVTPVDSVEALNKIREALTIYLSLPLGSITHDGGFAGKRLQEQIFNLQHSQDLAVREIRGLLLTQSEIIRGKNSSVSQKDSTIEQRDTNIEKITSKSIMLDSLENKEEYEKIFDGLEIGESKWLREKIGIKFNLAKSLKSLSGKLTGKDDGIISLNLEQPAGNK